MEEKKIPETITAGFEVENANLDLGAPLSSQLKTMSAADWRQQCLEEYLNCVLCGQDLNFSHIANFSTLEVEEEAHCLACKVRARKDHYVLQ